MQIQEAFGQDGWATRPGEQHSIGANLAFGDGHAAYRRWRWSRPSPAINSAPANAADRADFQFLKDHLPKR